MSIFIDKIRQHIHNSFVSLEWNGSIRQPTNAIEFALFKKENLYIFSLHKKKKTIATTSIWPIIQKKIHFNDNFERNKSQVCFCFGCSRQKNPFFSIERITLSRTSFLTLTAISFSSEYRHFIAERRSTFYQAPLRSRTGFWMSLVDNKLYANNLNINYKYIWPKPRANPIISSRCFFLMFSESRVKYAFTSENSVAP